MNLNADSFNMYLEKISTAMMSQSYSLKDKNKSLYSKDYNSNNQISTSNRDASSLDNTLSKARNKHDVQPLANKGPAPKDMDRSFKLNKKNYKMSHIVDKRIKPYTS